MLEVQQIYCFEPDKDNINFLKNKFKNEINNGLIIPIEIGIYYGLKEAKACGMSCHGEKHIHQNVGGMGIEECMKKVEKKKEENKEKMFFDNLYEN